jgi:HAD superfamily hydrolase (TIGR01484 family)
MKPLEALDRDHARALRGVLFDLDDTLLSHGSLTREAYDALWDLKGAGLMLVAVTGRPAGWGEVIARQWPIDAAVTENGAIVICREKQAIRRQDTCDESERQRRRVRLAHVVELARAAVPEVRLADDVGARTSDITWDIGETVHLPEDRIAILMGVIRDAGARTTRSSVHVHASFDTHDKASGAVAWLVRARGEDPASALSRFAYVGDSGNDRACFAAFHTTFGVANVRGSVDKLSVLPRYVAPSDMGKGFAEVARALLAARASSS